MSITAIGFIFFYILGLFLSLVRHPFFGLMTYLLVFYNNPGSRWWGWTLPSIRYAFIAGIITLVAVLFHPSNNRRPPWFSNVGAQLLILWTLLVWLQNFWAIDFDPHLKGCILFMKYLLLFALIHVIVVTEEYFDWFLFANIVGGLIFGWIAYQDAIGGGRFEKVGAAGVDDANTLGMYLGVLLAAGGFLFLKLRDWRKWVLLTCFPFILNGLILTMSRGAFVGVVCGGIVAAILSPATKRKMLIGIGILGICLFILLADDKFLERVQTVAPDEHGLLEGSAASRFDLAKYGWEMAQDHFWGVGFGGHKLLSPLYMPDWHLDPTTKQRSSHNTFMSALVEQGFVGAFIFLALWVWAGWTLLKLKTLDRYGLNESLGLYRAGIGSGLTVLFVAGLFHNYLLAEIGIWLFALLSSFSVYCHQSVAISSSDLTNREKSSY